MPSFLGLQIGDDGFGFAVPTLGAVTGALGQRLRDLRGIANLNVSPGSQLGDIVALVAAAVDLGLQACRQVVDRTIFTAMQGVAVDQFLADYLVRVQASPTTVVAYPYGAPGAAIGLGTLLRTSSLGVAFATDGAVVIPAAPTIAYAFEIIDFAAGLYVGQPFTVTVNGTPVAYVPNTLDDGFTVRNGLVDAINLTIGIQQTAYRGGKSPTSSRYAALVIEELGGGPFPFAVAGPPGAIFGFVAVASPATCQVTGPQICPPESLRYWSAPVGAEGVVNPKDGREGRETETDAQFKARHQIAQRGLGGGSPDAIRAIMLADPVVGGGGASFCTVEYNPDGGTDTNGNVGHSVRIVIDADADGPTAAQAAWRAKAAGDAWNGTEAHFVNDSQGNPQLVLLDRLSDEWIGVEVKIAFGNDWPNVGDPLAQLRQDIVDYVEALQPTANGSAVRVNLLPISTFPDGQPRGVVNFEVRVGRGNNPGGPFIFEDWYPNIQPNAELASVVLNGREKARCIISDVVATYI